MKATYKVFDQFVLFETLIQHRKAGDKIKYKILYGKRL